jgi:hypothetical protein
MSVYTIWFSIFILIAYFVIIDNSVARLLVIFTQFLRLQWEKIKWWLLYNPRNIIVRWMMYRKSMKMAEELMKEFEGRDK